MIRFLAILLLASFLPTGSEAHMYSLKDSLYIRVVAHPEMKDYYSYGLCQKKVSKYDRREYDHKHTDCIFPEGQYWWYLPNPDTYIKPDNPWLADNLLDVLQEDDTARAKIFTAEMVSLFWGGSIGAKWMGVLIPKQPIARKVGQLLVSEAFLKRGIKSFARGLGTLAIDMAAYGTFWEIGTNISDKITHTYWQKSQPYTSYLHYIDEKMGPNDAGIEVNLADFSLPKPMTIPVDPVILSDYEKTIEDDQTKTAFKDCFPDPENVSLPKDQDCLDFFIGREKFVEKNYNSCMENCAEHLPQVRGMLSMVYDPFSNLIPGVTGTTKFENIPVNPETGEEDINWAQSLFEYKGHAEVCEMHCAREWRTPSIKELWFKVSQQLAAADHHQYERVLFDYGVEFLPWSDHEEKLEITYMTKESIRKLAGDPRFRGLCPIGSECDKTHKFNRKPYETLEKPSFVKTDIWKLTGKYSSNVWQPMTPIIMKPLTNANPDKPAPMLEPKKLTHFNYSTINDLIREYDNRFYIRGDAKVGSIEVYSIHGEKQDSETLFNAEKNTLDLNSLPSGTYIVQIKLCDPDQTLVQKVLVMK